MNTNYLKQHAIVMNSPPERWWLGTPVGNGRMGGMVFFPGHFEILLNKLDIWTCDNPGKTNRLHHAEIMKMLRSGKTRAAAEAVLREKPLYHYSLPKSAGRLKFFPGENGKDVECESFRQELALDTARVSTTCRTPHSDTQIETFLSMDENVLVLRIKDKNLKGKMIQLERSADPKLGAPRFGHHGKDLWIDYSFPDGFRYVMALRIASAGVRVVRAHNALAARFTSDAPSGADIFLTIVTSRECDDPLARTIEILDAAQREGACSLAAAGQAWWNNFWQKSAIELPDKLVENLWYLHLYHLACISREEVAPGLFGLWFSEQAEWGGGYTGDINIAMTYWPIFSSNHLELGAPYYKSLVRALPVMKQETSELYGLPGVKIPQSITPYFYRDMSAPPSRYTVSCSLMYAQLFWWRYTYSGDLQFLREQAYPFLKEVLAFMMAYATLERDGKHHIYPSFSPEQGPILAKDATIDLAYLRYLLKAVIQAAKVLDCDAEKRMEWKRFLARLADYPLHCGCAVDSLTSTERDTPEMAGNEQSHVVHLRHPALYTPLYPLKETHFSQRETKLFKVMDQSFKLRFQQMGVYDRIENHNSFGWSWYACFAAWLGRGDKAIEFIYDRGISCQLLSNGMFVQRLNDYLCQDVEPYMLTDGCSGFVTAVNELLLQSFAGRIYVFPALPSSWKDCYFENLLAEGAFAVTAERKSGEVKRVVVHSLAGNPCQLANPWSGRKKLYFHDLQTKKTKILKSVPVLKFSTVTGSRYVIAAEAKCVRMLSRILIATQPRKTPRRFFWRTGTLGN